MKITVFGDSILKGVLFENGSYRRNGEWEEALSRELGVEIRNRSRFGCTVGKALPMLTNELKKPAEAGELVVLEFGGNDCDYDWAAIAEAPDREHLSKTPPERFAASYRDFFRMIREAGRKPVAVNLPPIHSERYLSFLCRNGLSRENILRWLGDCETIYRWQKTYSTLVTQLAREENVPLLDIRSAFPEAPDLLAPLLCADGIHPNHDGQKRIYRALSACGIVHG